MDAADGGGLLGQVEGRAAADVLAWLSTAELDWRGRIRFVAIDMSPSYKAAVRPEGHTSRSLWRRHAAPPIAASWDGPSAGGCAAPPAAAE